MTTRESSSPRHSIRTLAILAAIVGAVALVLWVKVREPQAIVQQVSSAGAPAPTVSGNPLPMPSPAVQPEEVTPLLQSPAFPVSLENQPGVRRRTGGPYVDRQAIIESIRKDFGCGEALPDASVCKTVVVQFYDRYESAFAEHGRSWPFASVFARDREVYLVTLRGDLNSVARFKTLARAAPTRVDHWNYQIDASTGEVMGSGTAGTLLEGEQLSLQ